MFLVDFMILTFELGPDRKLDSNVKINPLADQHAECAFSLRQYQVSGLPVWPSPSGVWRAIDLPN